jgi:hypothetical protein
MSNLTQMKPAFPDDLSLTRSDCLSPDHRSEVNTPDLSLQSSNRTSVTPVRFPSLLPFPAQREIGNPLHQLTNPVALPFRDLSLPFWLDTIRLFSVALSWGSPRLAVGQHPALRRPDFPRSRRTGTAVSLIAVQGGDRGVPGGRT